MPRYEVWVRRTETYVGTVEIGAACGQDAEKHVQERLNADGWDAIMGEDEGEYDECWSEVFRVEDASPPQYNEPLPDYGDLMPVDEFRASCEGGTFVDYDGHGCPVKAGLMADKEVKPSRLNEIPSGATHILWFNR